MVETRCVFVSTNQIIDPLPPIDHSEIKYPEFTKNFYEEHEEIAKMAPDQMLQLRRTLGLHVTRKLLIFLEPNFLQTFYDFYLCVFFLQM